MLSVVTQQYNIYPKTATFFKKSGGFTYLGLAAALAAWYNGSKPYQGSFQPGKGHIYLTTMDSSGKKDADWKISE